MLGALLRQRGALNEALSSMSAAYQLQKESDALVNLAGISRQMGDDANARRYAAEARAAADPDDAYNLACLEAICGDADAALAQLRRAAEMGKLDSAWAWKDPDFEALRGDPRFREIVGPPPQ
jgi:alkanesulfonate monooxygenase SsuD/methylene tetrahydromethanopterin reductase-like flavin-dependent oxidoreductase (luciferase family)